MYFTITAHLNLNTSHVANDCRIGQHSYKSQFSQNPICILYNTTRVFHSAAWRVMRDSVIASVRLLSSEYKEWDELRLEGRRLETVLALFLKVTAKTVRSHKNLNQSLAIFFWKHSTYRQLNLLSFLCTLEIYARKCSLSK